MACLPAGLLLPPTGTPSQGQTGAYRYGPRYPVVDRARPQAPCRSPATTDDRAASGFWNRFAGHRGTPWVLASRCWPPAKHLATVRLPWPGLVLPWPARQRLKAHPSYSSSATSRAQLEPMALALGASTGPD